MMRFGLSSMNDFHSLVWLYSFWLVIHLSKTSIRTTALLTGSFIVSSISWCIGTINPVQWVISGLGNLSLNRYASVLVSLMVHLHWDNKNWAFPFCSQIFFFFFRHVSLQSICLVWLTLLFTDIYLKWHKSVRSHLWRSQKAHRNASLFTGTFASNSSAMSTVIPTYLARFILVEKPALTGMYLHLKSTSKQNTHTGIKALWMTRLWAC